MRATRASRGREETLAHYDTFAAALELRCGESVVSLERCPAGFLAGTARACYEARRVLLATGGFGVLRRLGVPGECERRVSYRFHDAAPCGRGDRGHRRRQLRSEAALWLHEDGARVTLPLRRCLRAEMRHHDEITSVKTYNIERLKALAGSG